MKNENQCVVFDSVEELTSLTFDQLMERGNAVWGPGWYQETAARIKAEELAREHA